MYEFRLRFHWSLFLRFQLTILKFIPQVSINNIPALVQIMAWCRSGNKPLSEPMMVILLTHICVTRPQWVNKSYPPLRPNLRSPTPRCQKIKTLAPWHRAICSINNWPRPVMIWSLSCVTAPLGKTSFQRISTTKPMLTSRQNTKWKNLPRLGQNTRNCLLEDEWFIYWN